MTQSEDARQIVDSEAEPRTRARRWKILIALLPVVGLLVYFGIIPAVQPAILGATLPTEALNARQLAQPSADLAHATWLTGVSKALGLNKASVYSASYDVCYEDHDFAGMFASSWNRKCQISYVDFYQVPGRNGAVETAIKEAQSDAIGPHSGGMVFIDGYLTGADMPTEGVPADLPMTLWATLPGTSDALEATDEWMVADSVVAYAAHDAFLGRRLLAETGNPQLNPAKQYVVVPHAHIYFTKVLGCAIGRPLFCSSPLGR